MKRISLRLFFALATFFVGVSISTFWVLNQSVSNIETSNSVTKCQFPADFPEQYSDSRDFLGQQQALITGIPASFWEIPLEGLPKCISEAYRFVLIPNSQSPIAIRIWRSGNKQMLVAKKLHNGSYPIYKATNSLTEEEWLKFKSLLNQSSFWEMPKFNKDEPASRGEIKWIMEAIKDNKYHNVQVFTPSEEFRDACKYLLKLSKSELKNEYMAY
jgi:hypothetical protein